MHASEHELYDLSWCPHVRVYVCISSELGIKFKIRDQI